MSLFHCHEHSVAYSSSCRICDKETAAKFTANSASLSTDPRTAITPEDIAAAAKFGELLCATCEDQHIDALCKAFTAHRTTSFQQGYDTAIVEITAWLRDDAKRALFAPWMLANSIEKGDHRSDF